MRFHLSGSLYINPAGLILDENGAQFAIDARCGGDERVGWNKVIRGTRQAGDDTAGFFYDESASGQVPRGGAEIPMGIGAAAGGVTQGDGDGAKSAHPLGGKS